MFHMFDSGRKSAVRKQTLIAGVSPLWNKSVLMKSFNMLNSERTGLPYKDIIYDKYSGLKSAVQNWTSDQGIAVRGPLENKADKHV